MLLHITQYISSSQTRLRIPAGTQSTQASEMILPELPDLNHIVDSIYMHSPIEVLAHDFATGLFTSHFCETIKESRSLFCSSKSQPTELRQDCRSIIHSDNLLKPKSDWDNELTSDAISEIKRILSAFLPGQEIDVALCKITKTLSEQIWCTRVQWFPMMFVDVVPVLILIKKVILLWTVETDSACVHRIFQEYMELLNGLLAHLCKIEVCDESTACFSFLCDRVLEIGLHAQTSIHSIIVDIIRGQRSSCIIHVTIVSVLDKLVACKDHINQKARTSPLAFVHEIAVLLLERGLSNHDCIEESLVELASKLPDPYFQRFILTGLILRYFAGDSKSAKIFLSKLSKATDPGIAQRAVKFACGEFAFVALQRKSGRVHDTSPSRVPRLLLENVAPTQNHQAVSYEPVDSSVFPLASTDLAPEFIHLVAGLIFRNNKVTLNEEIVDLYPSLNGKPPVLFHLLRFCDWLHSVAPSKAQKTHQMLTDGGHGVLGDFLFKVGDISGLSLIGSGQFGSVYKSIKSGTAIKLVKVPMSEEDRCTFYAALNESLCQHLCSDPTSYCLSLIACGRVHDKDYFYIESPLLSGNLKCFRQQLPRDLIDYRLKLQLVSVFWQILKAVEFMHNKANIVHYDLKLDNILIDTGNFTIETHPFFIPRIAVGDFGEARIVYQDDFCTKNRGTECIKSPEMISIARGLRKDVPRYDRRKVIGTSKGSDIWSLGCLFYELMTGDFLFGESDGDWLSFYYKLTDEKQDLFQGLDPRERLTCDAFVEFIQFCLVRDPSRRPNIKAVVQKFNEMQNKVAQMAPRNIIPCFQCRFPAASCFIDKSAHT